MHNSVSTENTCVKRKYTLTETVKGEKQPHPPLEQWSLPPPPPPPRHSKVHKTNSACWRRYEHETYFRVSQVSATDPHTQKSAVIPRTNKQTQKSKGGLSANKLATTLSVIGTGRIQAVRSREWPVPAASRWRRVACIRPRSRGIDLQKVPAHSSAANSHGRSQ